jgi:hypothetical protein
MGASTAKGTRFENWCLPWLRLVWPNVLRAAKTGIKDFGDFVNTDGELVEAKWRATTRTWSIPFWVGTALEKCALRSGRGTYNWRVDRWQIIFAEDMRKGLPPLVVLDARRYCQMRARLEYLEKLEATR